MPAPPFRGATQLPGLRPPRAESAGEDPGTIPGPGHIAGVSACPGVAGRPETPGQLNPLRPRFHHVVLPWNAVASSTLLDEIPHVSSRFHHPRLARRLRLGDRGPAARGLQAEPVRHGGAPADNPSARGEAHAPIGRPCGSWLRRPAGRPAQCDRGPHGPALPSHPALPYDPRGIFEVPIRRSARGLQRDRGRAHGAAEVHRGKAPGRDVTASSCQALTPRSSARRWPRNASQQT